jgi:LysR family hydrogen peroxide-inducible transcriptional activator
MAALPSLRQLSYLVALSETLNFTQAAQARFVTQSTLSGGIQELERLLGASLVERDRQQVRFTPLGLEVVERARVLLTQAGDLVSHVARCAGPLTGLVRLGAIPTVAPYLLPPLMRAAREQLPELRIALREERTATLLTQVNDASLDFALIALPYETSGLLVIPLFEEELWLIGADDDPATRTARPTLDSIDASRLLLLAEGHCLREHVLQTCRLSEPLPEIEATSLTTLAQMVEAGMGIAIIPEMAIRGGLVKGMAITARPIGSPAPRRGIALVARPTSARLEAFETLGRLAAELAQSAARGRIYTKSIRRPPRP